MGLSFENKKKKQKKTKKKKKKTKKQKKKKQVKTKLQVYWLYILDVFELYSCPTSFGKKYDHFSLLCKQMDIYLRKVYIVKKVTSAPTFLA